MRILLDENLPQQLRHYLPGHEVATVTYTGWKGVQNGKLLDLAEENFDVLITLDRSLPFQQNLGKRKIGVIVLDAPDNQLHTLMPLVPEIQAVLGTVKSGEWVRVGV